MEILLWLVPAAVVTGLAMIVAAIAGRERTSTIADQAAAQERLAEAVIRAARSTPTTRPSVVPRPTMSAPRPVRTPSDAPSTHDQERRSA